MQDQASQNLVAFRAALPGLLDSYRGAHALLHCTEIVGYFPTSLEAIMSGYKNFGEGNFSVELVDDATEDLGFFSHVSTALHA